MTGWNHDNANWNKKLCFSCGEIFSPKSGGHKFCSISCKRKHHRISGCESTEHQYKLINGNWEKFFKRLLCAKESRSRLSVEDCLDLLKKQDYKCALTGVELTCILEKGVIRKTNVSLDKINPKGEYLKENVQLVCAAVNKFRVDMEVNEFIEWCKKVSDYALQKQKR